MSGNSFPGQQTSLMTLVMGSNPSAATYFGRNSHNCHILTFENRTLAEILRVLNRILTWSLHMFNNGMLNVNKKLKGE